jgi:uncharacterized protein YacL
MDKTLIILRSAFVTLALAGCFAFWHYAGEQSFWQVFIVGMGVAALTILVDIAIKGFSIRGLTALSFGLALGILISYLITVSPLFEPMDKAEDFAETAFLIRLITFIVVLYLSMVIALRGKDDFNLIIPYVRFVPQNVDSPLALVDTSALIDGRLLALCENRWFTHVLIIPRFVLDELQAIADSNKPDRKERGRRGMDVLNRLRKMPFVDLRINESAVPKSDLVDSKLIFLAGSMRAKIITTDFNLARMAEFHGIQCLDIDALTRSLQAEIGVGTTLSLKLVKAGKERGQAVGFLPDGSMVVVEGAADHIGQIVNVSIDSAVPSGAGKLIFAQLENRASE